MIFPADSPSFSCSPAHRRTPSTTAAGDSPSIKSSSTLSTFVGSSSPLSAAARPSITPVNNAALASISSSSSSPSSGVDPAYRHHRPHRRRHSDLGDPMSGYFTLASFVPASCASSLSPASVGVRQMPTGSPFRYRAPPTMSRYFGGGREMSDAVAAIVGGSPKRMPPGIGQPLPPYVRRHRHQQPGGNFQPHQMAQQQQQQQQLVMRGSLSRRCPVQQPPTVRLSGTVSDMDIVRHTSPAHAPPSPPPLSAAQHVVDNGESDTRRHLVAGVISGRTSAAVGDSLNSFPGTNV